MVASQIRANARESLTGKWGKAALITLVFVIITFVISFVCNLIPAVGSIILYVIDMPISYGLLVSFMKLKRGEDVGYVDFLTSGFSAFGKVWGVFGNMLLKLILPICLIVISIIVIAIGGGGAIFGAASSSVVSSDTSIGLTAGFGFLAVIGVIAYIASLVYFMVKSYLYSLSYYILNDNPDMTGKEIVEESARLMMGNRWRFFWLGFSFIGWAFLAGCTLGIGMLWLMPYMMVAMVCFYEELAGKGTTPAATVKAEVVTDVKPEVKAEAEVETEVNPITEDKPEDKTE